MRGLQQMMRPVNWHAGVSSGLNGFAILDRCGKDGHGGRQLDRSRTDVDVLCIEFE